MPLLAEPQAPGGPPHRPPPPWRDSRAIQFESLDGTRIVGFDDRRMYVMPGVTGFELPPVDVAIESTPGLDGGWLRQVTVRPRELFVPLFCKSEQDHAGYLAAMDELRGIVAFRGGDDPTGDSGSMLIVARSAQGERLIPVQYTGGLEGDESSGASGSYWAARGVTFVAAQPYWQSRTVDAPEFTVTTGGVYLGTGDNTHPWPRRLSPSVVLGVGMSIPVMSTVPVWPVIEVIGPATTVTYAADTGAAITYTAAVAAGRTLTIATDPRTRSARLDTGAAVWGNLALGSRFLPLQPGANGVSVTVPGATSATRLRVVYRRGWSSAW